MIRAAAVDVLTAAKACYRTAAAEVCGLDAPRRAMVTHGAPVWDDEQLSVAILGTGVAYQSRCAVVLSASLMVWVVRCHPTVRDDGTPPAEEDIENAALTLADDAWLLAGGLAEAAYDGSLFPSFDGVRCEQVRLGPGRAEPPSGGLAGWSLPITVDLSGAVLSG